MTPIYNTTMVAPTTAFRLNSPILYISCGLAVLMCVIACALVTLACSYKKPSTSIRDEVKPSLLESHGNMSLEKEAKIVIVMPGGDINPSYLAKLVPSSTPRLHKV